jgi:hypothetical protein
MYMAKLKIIYQLRNWGALIEVQVATSGILEEHYQTSQRHKMD